MLVNLALLGKRQRTQRVLQSDNMAKSLRFTKRPGLKAIKQRETALDN